MKFIKQTIFGDGSNGDPPGNCVAACVASLLEIDIDMVPNFAAHGRWYDVLKSYFHKFGYDCLMLRKADALEWCRAEAIVTDQFIPTIGYYIACGMAERGFYHAVIMRDGHLIHDPHPSDAGLTSESIYIIPFKFY